MADEDIDIAAIAARFLAHAPPLQFPPVLDGTRRTGSAVSRRTRTGRFLDTRNIFGCADVKSVVDDASIMDAVAPKARKAYNTDQMTSIDGPDGKVRLCM
jgi:hypothetical protein